MSSTIASRMYSRKLQGQTVFLSASFPSHERSIEFFQSARPFDLADATIAAVRAILGAGGKMVSGGHPTISPLILSVGRDFLQDFIERERPFIHIYQAEWFRDSVPEETIQLESEGMGKIHWTSAETKDRGDNLRRMRIAMLSEMKPVAAILVGGMEGVYKKDDFDSEFYLFKKICSNRPIYPVAYPGGASRILLDSLLSKKEQLTWTYKRLSLRDLQTPMAYSDLMMRIVQDIADQLQINNDITDQL